MKRKRKHKREKSKSGSGSGSDSTKVFEKDDDRNDSAMEIDNDTPSSNGTTDQPQISEKPLARVTVKLKTPKAMESQLNSESDTDNRSTQKLGSETQGKNEDSDNSLPETKKAASIKIKSSSKVSGPTNDQKTTPFQRYDKQELETALLVIKKIMKMDAAEPFNVPVNPVALGIPDYFDVIDTPMDFGTICNNLENGAKYANSEDVYKDVQFIWDNCFKYNNKGDYILDLMKRVKKNFMKYWNTAGLYSEQQGTTNGVESSQEKNAPTSQIKVYVKGGLSKKSSKKGHGRRHKSDCLCAICVLKRRRREREENAKTTQGLIGESSAAESPSGDNLTSDMDESTADPSDMKTEESKQQGIQASEEVDEEEEEEEDQNENENEEENNGVEAKDKDKGESTKQVEANKRDQGIQSDPQQPKNNKEFEEKGSKIKARGIKVRENPMLMELCGTLFPSNASTKNSIWIGRHSLIQKHDRKSKASICSSIRAAIDMLKLKQQSN